MKRYAAALVIGFFPFLFIIDEKYEFATSPILTGLVILALVAAFLGPVLYWVFVRRVGQQGITVRISPYVLVMAWLWFGGWWLFGS